jgi:hypothetical protein
MTPIRYTLLKHCPVGTYVENMGSHDQILGWKFWWATLG